MDELGETGYFMINAIMVLILATFQWGINALIVYGTYQPHDAVFTSSLKLAPATRPIVMF
jgi:hypothetical protein